MRYKVLALVAIVLVSVGIYKQQQEPPPPKPQQPESLQALVPSKLYEIPKPDTKYPPPAKNALSFYKTYNIGEVSLEVQKGETNHPEENNTGQTFYITYQNLTDKELIYSDPADPRIKAVNIGCIGLVRDTAYLTFKAVSTLFDSGGFSGDLTKLAYETTGAKAVPALRQKPGFTLPPSGGVKAIIEVQKDCLYLGTFDGENYWQLR